MTEPQESLEPSPEVTRTYRPTMLIFLLMPLVAAIVALLISDRIGVGSETTNPPAVAYTPYTLVENPAPDFTLPTPDGGTVSLSNYKGKWLVLNFWATWCPPCREEMPLLEELARGEILSAKQLGEVEVLAVSREETAPTVRKFLYDWKLTLPVALDEKSKVANQFGVFGLPTTFIIDPEGVVRYKQVAPFSPELLDKALALMAEKVNRTASGG